MARQVTVENKQQGKQYTPEETKQYEQNWAKLSFITRKLTQGESMDFPVANVTVGDTEMHEKTFQNVTTEKPCRHIVVQLGGELEGMSFDTWSADNVQNDKTALHKLYRAKMGETPPPKGRFSYDVDLLEGGEGILVLLGKGGPRKDGKYGGYFFDIAGFKRIIEDDDDESYEDYIKRTGGESTKTTTAAPAEVEDKQEDEPDF